MVIGVLQIELTIPSADSLKAKRMVLRSLKDRLRRNFNVSIAEVGENDQWGNAVLAVVMVSNDRRFTNQVLSKIVNLIESSRDLVLDDYQLSLI
ncbi:MAG TPA: DUF503 domain-containing protein [Verrucomicrobiae bacterium]|nr:DUF503 domain-containing protein [Verrucomicrobiae bacterium]